MVPGCHDPIMCLFYFKKISSYSLDEIYLVVLIEIAVAYFSSICSYLFNTTVLLNERFGTCYLYFKKAEKYMKYYN